MIIRLIAIACVFTNANGAKTSMIKNKEILKLRQNPPKDTQGFSIHHLMYRIKDPGKSLPFYTDILGMRLFHTFDFPDKGTRLYYLGYHDSNDLDSGEDTIRWWKMTKAALELVYEYGTENDPNFEGYHTYTSDPLAGFGHMGISVPDINDACKYLDSMNVTIVQRPEETGIKYVAFILDPDGYLIEIIERYNIYTMNPYR